MDGRNAGAHVQDEPFSFPDVAKGGSVSWIAEFIGEGLTFVPVNAAYIEEE